ncbi:hypothetical protein J6590_039767 [Homalodisca vitripennis]|nr:hypothetical protein J6590_039767 [Homalodisca vitripennis]
MSKSKSKIKVFWVPCLTVHDPEYVSHSGPSNSVTRPCVALVKPQSVDEAVSAVVGEVKSATEDPPEAARPLGRHGRSVRDFSKVKNIELNEHAPTASSRPLTAFRTFGMSDRKSGATNCRTLRDGRFGIFSVLPSLLSVVLVVS